MNLARYYYKVAQGTFPDLVYVPYNMRVEIIGETTKMYKIKYLDYHHNGAPPGHTTKVLKKNIRREGWKEALPGRTLSNGAKYIPDSEDIRKPYKDD